MAPLSKEQMAVLARNATLRAKTPTNSRQNTPRRPLSATGRRALETARPLKTERYAGLPARPKDDEVVLVCPENTVSGEALFFRDGGVKCQTTVPPNIRPGQRFKVRKSECSINGNAPKRPPRPVKDVKPKAFPAPLLQGETKPPADLNAHVDKKDPFRDPFVRDLPNVTWEDKALIEQYKKRRDAGLVVDGAYWKDNGFKAVGDPLTISEKKKKANGYGAPKWSTYYRPKKAPEGPPSPQKLGDREWWASYGFKGAVSEEKKRDYGNGVPNWSPYSHATSEGPLVRTGLPADAFWFNQFGFKMGGLSEVKKRDYGHGFPFWSPYNRPKGKLQRPLSCPAPE